MENNELKIKQNIMHEIEQDHIKMRPKAYFIAGAVLLGFGFMLAVVFSVLSVSIANFHLRNHEPLGYLAFGQYGVRPFLETFPFIPMIFAIASIGLGIFFIRKYEISYHHSLLGIVAILVVSSIAAGYVLDESGFNEKIAHLEPMYGFYDEHAVGDDWIIGEIEIVNTSEKQLVIFTPRQEKIKVFWDEQTMLPLGAEFNSGQRIRVVGYWEGDLFHAVGISSGQGMRWRQLPTMPEPKVRGYRYMTNPPQYPLIAE